MNTNSNASLIQQHNLVVSLDGGKTLTLKGRASIGAAWGVTAEISYTCIAFTKEDAAPFLVNLRGKQVRIERSIDTKFGTVTAQKFEETSMLTGFCYILRLRIRLESESGIPQTQTNYEKAFKS